MALPPNQDANTELFDLETGLNADERDFQEFGDVILTPQAHVESQVDITNANIHMGSHDTRGPVEPDVAIGGPSVRAESDVELRSYEVRISRDLVQQAMDADGPAGIPVVFDAGSNDAFLVIENIPEGFTPTVGTRNEDGSVTVRGDQVEDLVLVVERDAVSGDGDAGDIVFVVVGNDVTPIVVDSDPEVEVTETETVGEEDTPQPENADPRGPGFNERFGDRFEDEDEAGIGDQGPGDEGPDADLNAQAARLQADDARGTEDQAIDLKIEAALRDTDGSETLSITVRDVPPGATLSAGTDNGDGTWTLEPGELDGLTITPATDQSRDFTLKVEATTTETASGDERTVRTELDVIVDGDADTPTLTVGEAVGNENARIDLDISAALTDTDGSERLSITISNIPEGAVLRADGAVVEITDGAADLTPAQLDSLTITPPNGFFGQMNLGVTAVATEADSGDTASFVSSVQVDVREEVTGTRGTESIRGGDGSEYIDAKNGNDDIRAGGGDDVVDGGSGKDTIRGDAGSDTLDGGSSDDKLYGGSGDDTLIGGSGKDTLDGGSGNDTFVLDGNNDVSDVIKGGSGTDRIVTDDDGDFTMGRFAGNNSVEIVDGGDTESDINGTNSGNSLDFRNAELRNIDQIDGGGGNDSIYGSRGSDDVAGGSGNDTLRGEGGDDVVDGGTGNDKIYGGSGADTLTGGSGKDTLDGGSGNDTFVLDGNNDVSDVIKGGSGTDRIVTDDDGDFTLGRFAGNNSVEIVDGGETESDINGTNSNNTLDFRNAELRNIDQIDGGGGNDSIYGSRGSDDVAGGSGNDTLRGEGGDDVVDGGTGNDKIYGGSGADTLTGGSGKDTLDGGSGNDTFVLDGNNDVSDVIKGGSGTDRIVTDDDGDFTLGRFAGNNSVEIVDGGVTESDINGTNSNNTLDFRNAELRNIDQIDGGGGNDRIYGSRGADDIVGGSGRDSLYGEGGDDRIDGGTGNDRLYGGSGDDTLIGGQGTDQLDGGSGNDTFVLTGAGDAVDSIKGGSGQDTIVAGDDGDISLRGFNSNMSVEVIDGGETTSDILGTSGKNTLDFRNTELRNIDEIDAGANNDTVYGSSGDDNILGNAGKDKLYGESGDDRIDGGTGDDQIYGGRGDDNLLGGDGRDRLFGGDGDDTLAGGAGNDTLQGDRGDDLFVFGEGDGKDVASGGSGWLDSVRVDGVETGPGEGAWDLELTSGAIEEQADGYVSLSADSSGTITMADGSELDFDGIERIEW